ncbi:MAG: peptide chain release factor N(5)-glutamine methyltransferase [Candidatus Omnitrophica bacterium]|nr:peptide chain release factor N(5)-glutamine methyltransferase [Candidatus Omnitrophota bacterium]MBU1870029.1 peptide chain release factor N(5)-glutamine methyltransferase [Candidatus Omnitrophota bacterium]
MNEAELLFTRALNCDRLSLYADKALVLDKDSSFFISSVLKRRISGEPIQYILGNTEFMGLDFKVTPDVLIPRQETEVLVEAVISWAGKATSLNILDLGTGSGCIAISLAKFIPWANITAVDFSDNALAVAKENAQSNKVDVDFKRSDLFEVFSLSPVTYDLIVSNPPYVASLEIERLQREVKYEPLVALDGGADGLDFYRRIINDSPSFLKDGGLLVVEMGFGQREAIERIFAESGNFEIIEVAKDYSGIERVIAGRKLKGR